MVSYGIDPMRGSAAGHSPAKCRSATFWALRQPRSPALIGRSGCPDRPCGTMASGQLPFERAEGAPVGQYDLAPDQGPVQGLIEEAEAASKRVRNHGRGQIMPVCSISQATIEASSTRVRVNEARNWGNLKEQLCVALRQDPKEVLALEA